MAAWLGSGASFPLMQDGAFEITDGAGETIDLSQQVDRMADGSEPPKHVVLFRQAKDLAMGVHPLSKYVPSFLLLLDALLCSLIISKVACKSPPFLRLLLL